MEEAHAVQVVGYDNNRQAWLIKNSWGPGFAAGGFAWVGFDAPGMCDRLDTYGFRFSLLEPQQAAQPRLAPAPGRKGCYTYRAVAGDYPEGLASRVSIPVQQLLLNNLAVIKDPSALPAGTTLLLCGVSPAVLASAVAVGNTTGNSSSSSSSSSRGQVAALLAIKRVMDWSGTALQDWQPRSTNPCRWTGVMCSVDGKQVTGISFWDVAASQAKVQLSGQLPSAALLRRLPGLVYIELQGTGVGGTLPEDWSQLKQLEYLILIDNKLSGG
jgi:hypothetical protein